MSEQEPAQEPSRINKKTATIVGAVVLAAAGVAVIVASGGSNPPTKSPAPQQGGSSAPPRSASAPPPTRQIDFSKICTQSTGATVPTGIESEADAYYAAMAQEIGLQDFGTLDAVLAYAGYPTTALKLQNANPSDLPEAATLGLATAPSPGAVLGARFFAPKITDVSQQNTPAKNVGWRNLVRLVPTADSTAHKNGIDTLVVLFNFFEPIDAANPFDGADSANTQVMLITSKPGASPIYWLDYGPTLAGAKLSKELDAFFDAGHTPVNAGKRAYYVPCGCIACHGGLQLNRDVTPPAPVWDPDSALMNYLDTDHWFDRVQPGEDFAALKAPVIFDAGGFDAIRTLNREMAEQNRRVQPGSMQQRAASHWLELHASSDAHVSNLGLRALPDPKNPSIHWTDDPSDVAALKLFNHYCFRCHGSVEFDAFDKSMVLSVRGFLLARLQPPGTLTDPRATMPPDRDMSGSDRDALRAFVLAH